MNRRSFLAALAAIPLLGRLVTAAPKPLSHGITPTDIQLCDEDGQALRPAVDSDHHVVAYVSMYARIVIDNKQLFTGDDAELRALLQREFADAAERSYEYWRNLAARREIARVNRSKVMTPDLQPAFWPRRSAVTSATEGGRIVFGRK